MSKETLDFVTPPFPPKNYKISSAFSYNFILALTSFLGDKLIVTSVQNNGNGTFSVSFRADPKGIDVEALKKLMNFMIEKGISTDGLFELVEVAKKLTRRREDVSQTHPPTPDTPREETPTESA